MPHTHVHGTEVMGRRMGLSVALTLAFVLAEAVAAYFANSLALLSDAGHNFADAVALVFSWYAIWIARKPADAKRTYGYHRVGILAALVNAVSLVLIALFIFWEAAQRFPSQEAVDSGLMIGVALAAFVLNGIISVGLRREAKHDLNVRGAYLHMLGDALSALGVVIAGVVVAVTHRTEADVVVSLLIGALILWSSFGILKEAVDVLLESVPRGLDMQALEKAIRSVPGVCNAHDLHVWTVASGIIACSCHIVVAEQSVRSSEQVMRAVTDVMKHQFGITHTTIQVEVEGCEPNALYCSLHATPEDHAGHTH